MNSKILRHILGLINKNRWTTIVFAYLLGSHSLNMRAMQRKRGYIKWFLHPSDTICNWRTNKSHTFVVNAYLNLFMSR